MFLAQIDLNHVFRPKNDLKWPYFTQNYNILGKPPCTWRLSGFSATFISWTFSSDQLNLTWESWWALTAWSFATVHWAFILGERLQSFKFVTFWASWGFNRQASGAFTSANIFGLNQKFARPARLGVKVGVKGWTSFLYNFPLDWTTMVSAFNRSVTRNNEFFTGRVVNWNVGDWTMDTEFGFGDWLARLAEVAVAFASAFSDDTWFFLGQVLHVLAEFWTRSWYFWTGWWLWEHFRGANVGLF